MLSSLRLWTLSQSCWHQQTAMAIAEKQFQNGDPLRSFCTPSLIRQSSCDIAFSQTTALVRTSWSCANTEFGFLTSAVGSGSLSQGVGRGPRITHGPINGNSSNAVL